MIAVLSIGTTHPWNIAGIGLDVCVGAELGLRVLSVVAAVSAQDAAGVHALHAIPDADVDAQLAAIPWDRVGAIRIGALGSPGAVRTVAAALRDVARPVVVDPVIGATRGGRLADDATIDALAGTLLTSPHAIVTPNLHEAAALLGRPVDRASMVEAAEALRARGARAVLLKGGHLDGAPLDILSTADGVERFEGERIAGEMRGTGCVLAMALACALARGASLRDGVTSARGFVREKIAGAVQFGGLLTAY
jgi:hydroxymethylpyrimidine/phosphomethylpyrimidine kinase